MDLRAPPRPLVRVQRAAWVWSIGILTAFGITLLIGYLQLRSGFEGAPAQSEVTTDVLSEAPVYVYRCADGEVRAEPCLDRQAPEAPSKGRFPITTYSPPRTADTPTGRRLLAEADARYRREVAAARIAPSPYEETTAITHSPRCRVIRQEREQIRIAMRAGYSAPEGERYRERYYELGQAGIRFGCWTGSPPPG